ncbi:MULTISPECIES: tripartite tricarboxylate transporter permease [unclassified Paracoccus (in: a-proteobacteria)]|uniref:tripartite tricarboxylate transporter permease n=1 Tax=unclassified Paracoccus (in: a-proteobacteria) TaxID=2688777 RepID=UPI001C092512|nr:MULTISPECIES: tripartite tricarboxylate transporter permease [unclassified Paracoccus (in: a-proteobacteria)]MBU2957735.1 tripartite tricarboxylate transporter permease [Paracoccus sp. C2R09]
MPVTDVLLQALMLVADPRVLITAFLAGAFGMFVGAMPGLTATMATALLVPMTFFMDPIPALAAIVAASGMAIFAGDIPGALLRIPGTPASAAYVEDSYRLAMKGQLNLALGTNLLVSCIGGLFGVFVLIAAAPMLAEFALRFTSYEYFWLAALGLSCAIFIASADPLKAGIALLIGLAMATVGLDPTTGVPRFTFGQVDLMAGVEFIPAMIGLFALAEVMRGVVRLNYGTPPPAMPKSDGALFRGVGGVIRRHPGNIVRGSLLGAVIGALPGAGADIAAWMSYAVSKRFSKTPEAYGTGHVEGLVDASAANNSAVGGAWIPALVFGIPGDSVTAIVIGVLYMKGMNPGPTVFIQNPQLIYAVFMIFILTTLMMVPLGWVAVKAARQVLRVPPRVLLPIVLSFCIVGAFAMTNSVFGIVVMLALGVLGWVLEENGFPVAPIILGLVLGGMFERMFMTSMIKSGGDLGAFFDRPIAAILGAAVLLIWGLAIFGAVRRMLAPKRPALQKADQ